MRGGGGLAFGFSFSGGKSKRIICAADNTIHTGGGKLHHDNGKTGGGFSIFRARRAAGFKTGAGFIICAAGFIAGNDSGAAVGFSAGAVFNYFSGKGARAVVCCAGFSFSGGAGGIFSGGTVGGAFVVWFIPPFAMFILYS